MKQSTENEFINNVNAKNSAFVNKIEVKKLLGRFDYTFELESNRDIKVLIAPNGCGKTTCFNIINFVFDPTEEGYNKIINIPFESASFYFSNGKYIQLFKRQIPRNALFSPLAPNQYEISFKINDEEFNFDDVDISIISSFQGLDFKNPKIQEAKDELINEVFYHTKSRYRTFSDMFFPNNNIKLKRKNKSRNTIKDMLLNNNYDYDLSLPGKCRNLRLLIYKEIGEINVNYIPANRLFDVDKDNNIVDSILNICDRIKNEFSKEVKKYNKLQQEANVNVVKNYLSSPKTRMNGLEFESESLLIDEYKMYVEKITEYQKIGLLDDIKCMSVSELKKNIRDKELFVRVYIDAFKNTLTPLDNIYEKYNLFLNILNERNRITRKKYKYSPESGIVLEIEDVNGKKKNLDLKDLSSGEKNDFIMFARLIFDSSEGDLILIDEPEISLHIEWQETFLDWMGKICDMNKLQAIVATHSPSITENHDDLIIEGELSSKERNENKE